jgi:hypothetical protein
MSGELLGHREGVANRVAAEKSPKTWPRRLNDLHDFRDHALVAVALRLSSKRIVRIDANAYLPLPPLAA